MHRTCAHAIEREQQSNDEFFESVMARVTWISYAMTTRINYWSLEDCEPSSVAAK